MEACYAERSKGCRDALPQLPIRKLPDQIHTRAFCVVTCTRSGIDDGKEKYDRRRATSAEWGCAQHTSGLGAGRRPRLKLRRPGREVDMIENRGAASGDGETQLVERKGERHPHRLVEFLAFALMHDRDHEIIRFDLELFERLEVVRRVRLAHEIQNALEEPQAPRARVPAQIAR